MSVKKLLGRKGHTHGCMNLECTGICVKQERRIHSIRSREAREVKPADIRACRLCGAAIWLEPAGTEKSYKTKEAWYHVGKYPRISCARAPSIKEPARPLGAGP